MSTTQRLNVATKIGVISFKEINDGRRYAIKPLRSALPRLRVRPASSGGWEAVQVPALTNRHGVETVAIGKSAEAAFKNAVKTFWHD